MGLVEVRSVGITKDVLQVAVSTHQKQVTSDKDMYQKTIFKKTKCSLTNMWSRTHVHHYTAAVPVQAGDCPSGLH